MNLNVPVFKFKRGHVLLKTTGRFFKRVINQNFYIQKGGFSRIELKPPFVVKVICDTINYPIFLTLMRYSAICTAFSAAPFFIWSPTIQNVSPFSSAKSLRIRPT